MTWPRWLRRAVRNRHRHAIEQAARRWRGGRRGDSGRTCRKILISTQANTYILIGSEALKVTAVSTNALTVIRGQDGTTATTHLDAAKVFLLKSNVKLTSTEPYAQPRVETTINEGAAFAKSDTTLTVTSGTTLGAVANSYILIGSEFSRSRPSLPTI